MGGRVQDVTSSQFSTFEPNTGSHQWLGPPQKDQGISKMCVPCKNKAIANYRLTHTSWRCILSAAWLRTLSPPSNSHAERRKLPLTETNKKEKIIRCVYVWVLLHFIQTARWACVFFGCHPLLIPKQHETGLLMRRKHFLFTPHKTKQHMYATNRIGQTLNTELLG